MTNVFQWNQKEQDELDKKRRESQDHAFLYASLESNGAWPIAIALAEIEYITHAPGIDPGDVAFIVQMRSGRIIRAYGSELEWLAVQ